MKWWQKTICYELYPKSFLDTTGSGTGDIQGIINKLDYLEELGIGAVWITPVFKSPMKDNGYDVIDYCSIDPGYGTMADMDRLFEEAGKRNIRIIMDLVVNHTSDENPWFLESKKDRTNSKADWYVWRDEPANWRSIFGGSAWTWCEERGQYYLHTFGDFQPDLNWANPEVRKAIADAALFWLDKGAGGFRIDAVPYIRKPDVFTDGTPDGSDGMISVHDMTANLNGILDYLHEFKDALKGYDIFTVGEANGVKAEQLNEWVGPDGVFDMIFEFSHVNLEFKGIETWCRPDPWTISDLKKALFATQHATKENGWATVFFENHDKPRSVDHYFSENADKTPASKAIGVLLYTLRGTPFLYQGQELGYRNVKYGSIEDYNDVSSYGQYHFALEEGLSEEEALACVHRFSRDSARTPMQWDDTENAGFSKGKPWLPVHEDYKEQNVSKEEKDSDSILTWYKNLARVRKTYPALTEGELVPVNESDPCVMSFVRKTKDQEILIAVNLSEEEIKFEYKYESIILSSVDHEDGKLKPLEASIFLLK